MKISGVVAELIDSRPYLADAIADGLINHSALTRMLLPDVRRRARRASPEAVHAAIRRYVSALPLASSSREISGLLAKSTLSLKNAIVDMSLRRNGLTFSAVRDIADGVKWGEGEVLYLIQGGTELVVVLDKHNADRLKRKVGEANIRKEREGLSTVSLKSPMNSREVPGFYSFILGFLAKTKISLMEFVSTASELVLVVDSKQATSCYGALAGLIERSAVA